MARRHAGSGANSRLPPQEPVKETSERYATGFTGRERRELDDFFRRMYAVARGYATGPSTDEAGGPRRELSPERNEPRKKHEA
jgi:hypothetical protein